MCFKSNQKIIGYFHNICVNIATVGISFENGCYWHKIVNYFSLIATCLVLSNIMKTSEKRWSLQFHTNQISPRPRFNYEMSSSIWYTVDIILEGNQELVMFRRFSGTPLTNHLKRSNSCIALYFLFDTLWCLENALSFHYRITPFETMCMCVLMYMYMFTFWIHRIHLTKYSNKIAFRII